MLNPQPHISTHEPWIWRQFAQQLPLETTHTGVIARPASPRRAPLQLPSWSPGELVATYDAYLAALRTLGSADPGIIAMEADADSSTFAQVFPAAPAVRPVESIIADRQTAGAEQRMVAAA